MPSGAVGIRRELPRDGSVRLVATTRRCALPALYARAAAAPG